MPSNSLAARPPGSPAPAAGGLVEVALAGGGGGGGALAFPVEQRGAEGQVAVAGGGREEGFAFAQGDEQQVGGAGLVPEHAFAVDPGGAGKGSPV